MLQGSGRPIDCVPGSSIIYLSDARPRGAAAAVEGLEARSTRPKMGLVTCHSNSVLGDTLTVTVTVSVSHRLTADSELKA